MKEIYNVVKHVPSVYNLHPVRYLVITDRAKIEFLKEMNHNQFKIGVASAVILVLADKRMESSFEEIYKPLKDLGMMDSDTYGMLHSMANGYFTSLDDNGRTLEASTNGGIATGFLLLALKNSGWDSCPMHLNNYNILRRFFKIPENFVAVNLVVVGKEGKSGGRGFRRPFEDMFHLNQF